MADYYRNNIEECEDIEERYSLMLDRIKELADENEAPESYRGYFTAVAEFILKTADVLELVKTYMFMKVKLMFDPPLSSAVIECYKAQISEYEWRLNVEVDTGGKENQNG